MINRWHTGTTMPGNATCAGSLFDHFDEALIRKLENVRGGTKGGGLTEDFDV